MSEDNKNNKNINENNDENNHGARAIYLSCIDYRFVEDTVRLVERVEKCSCTDSFSLAGSSLGTNEFPVWNKVFKQHLVIAEELHSIKNVIFVEHMDCGAYKIIYGPLPPHVERFLHILNVNEAVERFKPLFPNFHYSGYLFHLNGKAEKIY